MLSRPKLVRGHESCSLQLKNLLSWVASRRCLLLGLNSFDALELALALLAAHSLAALCGLVQSRGV